MQTTKRMSEIVKELRDNDFYRKQPSLSSDPDELAHIAFDLYPTEVVRAAQKALGEKALSDYFVEIYEFAKQSQEHNSKVKKSQLSGVMLTHNKITKWLVKQGIDGVLALHEPAVLHIFLDFHIKQMESSLAMFKQIAQAIS